MTSDWLPPGELTSKLVVPAAAQGLSWLMVAATPKKKQGVGYVELHYRAGKAVLKLISALLSAGTGTLTAAGIGPSRQVGLGISILAPISNVLATADCR